MSNENCFWNKNNIHTNTQGFPTLVWGDIHATEKYNGPRDYESLSAHAKEHISKPICSLYHLEACSDEEITIIEWLQAKSDEEMEDILDKFMESVQHEIEDYTQQQRNLIHLEEADVDAKIQAVQAQHKALVSDFISKLSDVKAKFNFNFVEQIMTSRKAANRAVEEPEL